VEERPATAVGTYLYYRSYTVAHKSNPSVQKIALGLAAFFIVKVAQITLETMVAGIINARYPKGTRKETDG
jgi:hypothetical protein